MSGVDAVLDVLVVDADGAAGLEVAVDDHGDLGIHDCAACQSAADGLIDLLGICACLCGKHECFGDDCDGVVDDHLVGKLGCGTAAAGADQKSGITENIEERLHGVEILLVAAAHDGKASCDCAGLSAGNRCIYKTYSFFFQFFVAVLGLYRSDRAHIADQGACLDGGCYAALTEEDGLYYVTIRNHGDNDGALRSDFRIRGFFAAVCYDIRDCFFIEICTDNFHACLEKVLCHGPAHNSKTDKSCFHFVPLSFPYSGKPLP